LVLQIKINPENISNFSIQHLQELGNENRKLKEVIAMATVLVTGMAKKAGEALSLFDDNPEQAKQLLKSLEEGMYCSFTQLLSNFITLNTSKKMPLAWHHYHSGPNTEKMNISI
jgi:hypothetical protein